MMPQGFDPNPGDPIALFEQEYVVQPHPQVSYLPYRQKAGRARVYQLRNEQLGQYFALKEFKKLYRTPDLIDSYRNLHHVESFEGLRAAKRHIVLPSDPAAQRYPNLEYAMLMPWIHGRTWFDVLGQAQEDGAYPYLSTAIGLCDRFLEIVEGLEAHEMAHTDISPGNVMVGFDPIEVELVDLEDMYMPGVDAPPQQTTGAMGYQHRSGETTWRVEGDRYAAAVLAAEMLILAKPNLARKATDEGFFMSHCGTPEGAARFQEARSWLAEVAPEFAKVFERSWYADSLEGCPRISELREPIEKLANHPLLTESPKRVETPISRQPSREKVAVETPGTPVVRSGLPVFPLILIAMLIAALVGIGSVLAFRGGGDGEQASSKRSLSPTATGGASPTATIISDLPLQGSSRPQNETIVNAINLALEERGNMAGDVQIEYVSQDNATAQAGQWDEARCAENAQSAAQDESIVGWIGPFNSGCAQVEIPILNQAGLAMVSPANTALRLTKPTTEPGEPDRYYPTGERNYTRVIVADDKQGQAGATFMQDLGVQSVYILDDQEAYGRGLADQFQQAAEGLGIQVLGREGIDGNAANYRALMTQIAQTQPDAIYFGGITQNNAAQLVSDKLGAGMSNEDVIFMGPDGIREEAFLTAAGDAAEGIYVTFSGLPPERLPGGQGFVDRYQERFGGNVEAYTAYGYEAANVLLDAIGRAYDADGEVTREGVVRELFATSNYDGVLGTWSFDKDGDTTLTELSGQRVENGEFQFDRTIDAGEA